MQTLALAGAELRPVAGDAGLGQVGSTSRTRRVYAAQGEESLPYLRPYDVFDYLPQPADQLSKSGSIGWEGLVPNEGTILQTCSGRNLGPLAYADSYLSRFVVSDDMLRLNIDAEEDRFYVFAFLRTPTGQALLTRSKTGNVIDHLSPDDLGAVLVPFFDDALQSQTVADMKHAVTLREAARERLDELIDEFESRVPGPARDGRLADGWTHQASALGGRLDAAFHDPLVTSVRNANNVAGGVRVGDVAETFIPGRYKRYYVEPEHGKPIVSGRQLLQTQPINLRYIAARSFDFNRYSLEEGMLAFGAEGRAEDRISQPVLTTGDRTDWLANNHVMRVRPRAGVNPGWLYLCFASWQVQAQVKAQSCGSVVDAVYPGDLDDVILPPIDEVRGDAAYQCWKDFAEANRLEANAIDRLESSMLASVEAS
ncbi:hypothetical protein [Brevibacterium metallidurans]